MAWHPSTSRRLSFLYKCSSRRRVSSGTTQRGAHQPHVEREARRTAASRATSCRIPFDAPCARAPVSLSCRASQVICWHLRCSIIYKNYVTLYSCFCSLLFELCTIVTPLTARSMLLDLLAIIKLPLLTHDYSPLYASRITALCMSSTLTYLALF